MQEEKRKNLPTALSLPYPEEELRQRAAIDALSGLLNRDTLETCIKRRLDRMHPGESCALFIVDLDNFKRVNDTLGHQAGDQAIRETARQLSRLFRASDIVGRLGGDEFLAFMKNVRNRDMVVNKCEALRREIKKDIVLGQGEAATLSMGVAFAQKGQDYMMLYEKADTALYVVKEHGRNGFEIV